LILVTTHRIKHNGDYKEYCIHEIVDKKSVFCFTAKHGQTNNKLNLYEKTNTINVIYNYECNTNIGVSV